MSEELKTRDDRVIPREIPLDDLCNKALSSWGFDPQMDMAIEEMSELIKAILKYRRDKTQMRAMHLAEEYIDVKIMLRQVEIAMRSLYGEEFDIWLDKEYKYKLFKLEGMLERYNQK